MTQKGSSPAKSRTIADPLEIWQSADGEWEWRVLEKKSDLIWQCAVRSPNTFGDWEYGDVYFHSVTQNERTFVDVGFGPDYFTDLIPTAIGTDIAVPDPSQPRTLLPPDEFPFLCQYFAEDGMSFHGPDIEGNVVFFFNTPLEDCPTIMESRWGVQYSEEKEGKPGRFQFDLLIYDQDDDPLTVPFTFNLADEKHRYELTQIVEQETLPFFALALQGNSLLFYDSFFLQLPDDLRRDLAPVIRHALSKTAAQSSPT